MGWLLRSGFKGRLEPIPGPVMGHGEEISQRNKNGWHGEEVGDKKRCWERKPSTGTRDFSLRACPPLCSAERGNSWRKMSAQGWAMWPVSLRSKASLSLLAFLLFLLIEAETSNHNAEALI